MFRYVALLLVLIVQVATHKHLDLRNTQQFNLTFYYDHDYPEPDCHHVYLFALEQGEELKPLLQNISDTMASVKAVALLYNATVDDLPEGQQQTEIEWTDKFVVNREIFVEIQNEALLPDLVDNLNQLRNRHSLFLGYIEEGHLEQVDEEEAVAKEEALKESAQICEEYFGMELKELIGFHRVGASENATAQEEQVEQQAEDELNDSGDLFEVVQQIEQQQQAEDTEWQNAIFKVQIVCHKKKVIEVPPKDNSKRTKKPKKPSLKDKATKQAQES